MHHRISAVHRLCGPACVDTVPDRMAAPFPRWFSTAFRVGLASLLGGVVGVPCLLMAWMRSPYVTNVGISVQQPVKFDHRHHVSDDGIDCRYCHYTVETSASAGMPATSVCMNCHGQIWNASPLLEPVRASYFNGTPIQWRRVHKLPDFVYFDHSIHVRKGVGCVSCHGRVDLMPEVMKSAPLTMEWCLNCHRKPEPQLRPLDQITAMTWRPPDDRGLLAEELAHRYGTQHLTHCSACHR